MCDSCNDNRFELIEKYKKKLIESTNIETSPEEMKVIDNILFRFWQMGWLDKLESSSAQPKIILCKDCKYWTQSMGKMKGYGLGRCDFHDADLVTCNGYCYWAERRTDGTQRRHILAN